MPNSPKGEFVFGSGFGVKILRYAQDDGGQGLGSLPRPKASNGFADHLTT